MRRYASKIEDGTLLVEGEEGWIEVGAVPDIVDLVGGETYRLEYGDYGQVADWVDTDEDGIYTFDVRETIADMTFPEEFVEQLAGVPMAEDEDGYPERTVFYADMMTRIWDSKGDLEED
ncbi:MAG: hypothetical protein ABEI39_01575 [Halobacteriales archaeon]